MMLKARFVPNSARKTVVSLACAGQLVTEKDLSALLAALPAGPEPPPEQQPAGRNEAVA